LRANADEKSIANYQRYFKRRSIYGLSMSGANKIAVNYWKEIKSLSKPEIFALCEDLFNRITVKKRGCSDWAPRLTNQSRLPTGIIQALD